LKKKEKDKYFGHLAIFWFATFVMLFCATGYVFLMKTLEDEQYVVMKAFIT